MYQNIQNIDQNNENTQENKDNIQENDTSDDTDDLIIPIENLENENNKTEELKKSLTNKETKIVGEDSGDIDKSGDNNQNNNDENKQELDKSNKTEELNKSLPPNEETKTEDSSNFDIPGDDNQDQKIEEDKNQNNNDENKKEFHSLLDPEQDKSSNTIQENQKISQSVNTEQNSNIIKNQQRFVPKKLVPQFQKSNQKPLPEADTYINKDGFLFYVKSVTEDVINLVPVPGSKRLRRYDLQPVQPNHRAPFEDKYRFSENYAMPIQTQTDPIRTPFGSTFGIRPLLRLGDIVKYTPLPSSSDEPYEGIYLISTLTENLTSTTQCFIFDLNNVRHNYSKDNNYLIIRSTNPIYDAYGNKLTRGNFVDVLSGPNQGQTNLEIVATYKHHCLVIINNLPFWLHEGDVINSTISVNNELTGKNIYIKTKHGFSSKPYKILYITSEGNIAAQKEDMTLHFFQFGDFEKQWTFNPPDLPKTTSSDALSTKENSTAVTPLPYGSKPISPVQTGSIVQSPMQYGGQYSGQYSANIMSPVQSSSSNVSRPASVAQPPPKPAIATPTTTKSKPTIIDRRSYSNDDFNDPRSSRDRDYDRRYDDRDYDRRYERDPRREPPYDDRRLRERERERDRDRRRDERDYDRDYDDYERRRERDRDRRLDYYDREYERRRRYEDEIERERRHKERERERDRERDRIRIEDRFRGKDGEKGSSKRSYDEPIKVTRDFTLPEAKKAEYKEANFEADEPKVAPGTIVNQEMFPEGISDIIAFIPSLGLECVINNAKGTTITYQLRKNGNVQGMSKKISYNEVKPLRPKIGQEGKTVFNGKLFTGTVKKCNKPGYVTLDSVLLGTRDFLASQVYLSNTYNDDDDSSD